MVNLTDCKDYFFVNRLDRQMRVFRFPDYRQFLKSYLASLPKKGRGELSKISKHLGVHSTLMSLILSGSRDLTLEQAYELSQYLHFTDVETEYFSLLVQYERAGSTPYKNFLKAKMESMKKDATKVSQNFQHERVLNDEQKSIFYSTWLYSAIRLFTSTNEAGVSCEEVVKKFQLPRPQALKMLSFLVSTGLVSETDGRYQMAVQRTFLEQGSPHLPKHHSNWRVKALQKADRVGEKELMFTSPVSISVEDFEKIRNDLVEFLRKISQVVKDSPAEDIACLNIDFFWIDL
jgi:uncharacterized protein (TIGR02147 family)